MTARKRCWWVKFRECGELLYERFHLELKGAGYERYVRTAILCGSEAWCMKGSETRIFTKDRKIHGERNVWSTVQR